MYHYNNLEDNEINWSNINGRVSLKDVDKFEKNNKNIAITIIGVNENGNFVPLRITKNVEAKIEIDLLLIDIRDNWHYIYVKKFNRLLSMQYNKHKETTHFCKKCFHGFSSAERLKKHNDIGCISMQGSHIKLPNKYEKMEFKNFNHKFKEPIVIYADFESTLKKVNDSSNKNSVKKQKHVANSFGFLVVSTFKEFPSRYINYVGEDAEFFFNYLN